MDLQRPPAALVAHCRAGFEPETATDLQRLAALAGDAVTIDAPVNRGYVVARPRHFDPRRWLSACERSPPIFVRSLFVGSGPHSLLDAEATRGRADRIAPLTALIGRFCDDVPLSDLAPSGFHVAGYTSLRLETPDTNDGKQVSGLARALTARLADELRNRGLMAGADERRVPTSPANLHVLFADGAHAYVGASVAPWASRWPMGIPRLRMPGSAPSRSTLKLAEAFVTFLGKRESDLLRPGMRAVDLGAAPGGWTWQLAYRGLRVTAVDNGALKGGVADDPLVTHLRTDGLTFMPKRPVDWMTCDIVEQPARIAALVARWIGEGHARQAIFNLKLPMKKRYYEVLRAQAIIVEALAKGGARATVTFLQLYHDRAEVTGYVEASASGDRDRTDATPPRR
jgi:23S rRNA (cytidine2498-2'-O)-methyltransferase